MAMENYHSYPDSGESSPTLEVDCENPTSWDDPPQPPAPATVVARVKLMCSYGGRIQPRAHDNQLSYVGGETKILAVERGVRFAAVLAKLCSISGFEDLCLKYQLPGEDLDALITVANDEDLEHMMMEYDRLHRSPSKPTPRLRIFLFALNPPSNAVQPQEVKSDRQWFVDALNSIASPTATADPPPPSQVASPDYLFGLDKGFVPPPAVKVKDSSLEFAVPEPIAMDAQMKSDLVKDESAAEIQKQIQELQRLQVSENQEEQKGAAGGFPRMGSDETLHRVYPGEYYLQQGVPENISPPVVAPPVTAQVPSAPAYWTEHRSIAGGGARFASVAGGDQPLYFIPAGQGYYTTAAVPRMMAAPPDVYREATAVYTMAPPPPQPSKVATTAYGEGGAAPAARTQGIDGFSAAQVAYDTVGRAMYYAGAVPTYQTVASVAINSEGKVMKPSQVS